MGTLARLAFSSLWHSLQSRTGKSAHPTVLCLDKFQRRQHASLGSGWSDFEYRCGWITIDLAV